MLKTTSWRRALAMGISALALSLAVNSHALAQDEPLPAETLTIAVGTVEPGHLELMQRIAASFNTRVGRGEVTDRAMVSILAVEDAAAAMQAADNGRADLAFAAFEELHNDPIFGDRLDEMWKRAVAIEVLTIVTRRTRMVRDPRQLNGLDVELAGERVDRITKHMNHALNPHGISIQGGSFVSAGGMGETNAFLRLCRAEYDVRVDLVIHPLPTFAGNLPCEVRFMSFNDLDVPEADGIGVMRHVVPTQTYSWQRGNMESIGAAVALIDPAGTTSVDVRDALAGFLDQMSNSDPAILDPLNAALWAGQNPEVE